MEIELSLLGTPSRHHNIQALIRDYQKRSGMQVKVTFQNWDSAWSGIMRGGNRGYSPSVSEVGTSWVPDLAGIDALAQVPPDVLKRLGGEKDYVSQSWKSCFLFGSPRMWSIPWVCGSRVIYYRKDLLAKAGIKPEKAFINPQAMLETIIRLHNAGVARPWITSNVASLNTLHLVSSWIWSGGGDFISANGKRLLFTQPETLDAMAAFFALGRYMGETGEQYNYDRAVDLFWRGDAAVTMDGTWLYESQKATADLQVLEHLGVALPPGPAFVGGSNLVVWNSAPDKSAAWNLLLFLTEPDSALAMFKLTGLAPARLSQLNSRDVLQRAYGPLLNQAMETGRSLPNHRFSGMVEDNLHYAFGLVWSDVLKSPGADPREILTRHLVPLKERLEVEMNR